MTNEILGAEFGSSQPVALHFSAQMKDSEGNTFPIPLCQKCGLGMTTLIGNNGFQHYCMICDTKLDPKDPLVKSFIDNLDRAAEVDG